MKAQLLEDIGNNHQLPPPPRPSARASEPQRQPPPRPAPPDPPPQPQWTPPRVEPESRYGTDSEDDAGDWFDRWGRKAAGWLAVLLTALAVSGTGRWLYNENKVDTTLQVLAKAPLPARQARSTQAQAPAPAHAAAVSTPATTALAAGPQQAAPPPAQAPEHPATPAPAQTEATASAAPTPSLDSTAPLAQAPASARTRTTKRTGPAQAKYATIKPERIDKLSETLRQCRAAGYHAARCVQLGCEATRFGLACKGSSRGR